MIPAYVINLPQSAARRERITAEFSQHPEFSPFLITGVDGSALPAQARIKLSNHSGIKSKGALGCFLSHVRVWELVAELAAPFALVLEDDAYFTGETAALLASLPADFDLVFVNERMARHRPTDGCAPVAEALRYVELAGDGVGTDGYLLTPRGAAKLLQACETDFYTGYIDWRLARYAVTAAELDALGDLPVADVLRNHHDRNRLPALGLLRGYAAKPALVEQRTMGASVRQEVDNAAVAPAGATPLSLYAAAPLGVPPEGFGELQLLEAPCQIPRLAPALMADLSERGLSLVLPPAQRLHGSYLVQRQDVLLFGPNNLVTRQGQWCCEARRFREQFLHFYRQAFYGSVYPGPKPEVLTTPDGPRLDLSRLRQEDVERIDAPVFLATPLEPQIWGRWMTTVVPKAAQYRQYGGGRKFFCDVRHEWQRGFLERLGIAAAEILPHDPGRTYICSDVMTVEYSEADLCVSPAERVNFFALAARCPKAAAFPRKLFVSRLSRSRAHPNYRVLQNEAELTAALEAAGFTVIEPELYPVAAQIAFFAAAEQVVFLGGSGIFSAALCAPDSSVITIESTLTYAGNHAAFFAALGLRHGVIFGEEDVSDPQPDHRRWRLDIDRAVPLIEAFFRAA